MRDRVRSEQPSTQHHSRVRKGRRTEDEAGGEDEKEEAGGEEEEGEGNCAGGGGVDEEEGGEQETLKRFAKSENDGAVSLASGVEVEVEVKF
mmetsp:Transcript_75019/g.142195  ORF Transcript_75019/g.142195 Transcript_75019/m.142195 type:complete len:92 (-) Transcript_75019:28-303(-)